MGALKVWFKDWNVVTFEGIRAFYMHNLLAKDGVDFTFYSSGCYSGFDVPADIESKKISSFIMTDIDSISCLMEPEESPTAREHFNDDSIILEDLKVWFHSGREEVYTNLSFHKTHKGIISKRDTYSFVYEDFLEHSKCFGTVYLDCVSGYVVTGITKSNRDRHVIDREGVISSEQLNSLV